ncbi:hypothetical protein LCGC14_1942000 [marine sediment metagenome]|uniref:Uncharacterized protein n=1 Tax=marine sediment metagenome TaxID=412755 RepID=A0A0F9HYC7_9ZZZZ
MVLGNLIGGFVVLVVGVNLMPVVADQVSAAQTGQFGTGVANVTGAAATLIDLTTLFFALSIMATAISLGVSTLKQSGLV